MAAGLFQDWSSLGGTAFVLLIVQEVKKGVSFF